MSAPPIAMRCPHCGADLRIGLAPGPATQWFPCPNCRTPVPVVAPRDLPPLYSWEVLPGLYPPLPRPRPPRWNPRRAAGTALLVAAVLLIAFAGLLVVYAYAAPQAGAFSVSGSVATSLSGGGTAPAIGARVLLTNEQGATSALVVGPSGQYLFSGVPTGGVTLNVSLSGYAPVAVEAFVSPIYSVGASGVAVVLTAGGPGNGTTMALSAFPDLESFVAAIGAGVVLLAFAGAVCVVAAWITWRTDRPAVGVVGGGAGLLAPLALLLLELDAPFPIVIAGTGIAAAFGAFALAARAAELGQRTPPVDRD